jgi:hypothetical protein
LPFLPLLGLSLSLLWIIGMKNNKEYFKFQIPKCTPQYSSVQFEF